MIVGRRQFVGHLTRSAAAVALSSAVVSMSGCSVWTDILNWVPVGEAALNSILSILSANGITVAAPGLAIIQTIEAGFTALVAAIKEYQSTTPPPVGTLAKIETILTDIADNFSTFLKSLNISGGLLGVIVGLAQVVLSTIAGFMGQLPTPTPATAAHAAVRSLTVGSAQPVVVVPVHRTRRAFKKDFNATLDGGVKLGVNTPASAYLKLTLWEHL